MRLKPAADFEPINLLQVFIGPDRTELKDLVKSRVDPGGLGIIKKMSSGASGCHRTIALWHLNSRLWVKTASPPPPLFRLV
jgi:hypothetical protein